MYPTQAVGQIPGAQVEDWAGSSTERKQDPPAGFRAINR